MKRISLLFCLFTFSMTALGVDNVRFWEQYSDAERLHVLKSGAIEASVVSVYNNSISISDNDETFIVLNYLSDYRYGNPADGIVDAFYFHCFSKIVRRADGALAEVMGDYCTRIIKKSPDYAILYLKAHQKIKDKFVDYIGYEAYFSKDQDRFYEDLRECLKPDPSFADEFVTAVKDCVLQIEQQ